MSDLSAALIRCIDTRDAVRQYLENNGADGSQELAQLRQEEADAFAAHDVAIAALLTPP